MVVTTAVQRKIFWHVEHISLIYIKRQEKGYFGLEVIGHETKYISDPLQAQDFTNLAGVTIIFSL